MIISQKKNAVLNFTYLRRSPYAKRLYFNHISLRRLALFKFLNKKDSSKKIGDSHWGFTLIEILITLMIMGILMAALMPNFAKIQNKAKEVSAKNIAHQLQLAIESYYLSEGSYPSLENAGIEELGQELIKTGDLKELPKNPFTNMPYRNQDPSGQVRYVTDQNGYRLVVMGAQNQESILVLRN